MNYTHILIQRQCQSRFNVYLLLAYFPGFVGKFAAFMVYSLFLISTNWAATAMCFLTSAVTKDYSLANLILALIMTFQMVSVLSYILHYF